MTFSTRRRHQGYSLLEIAIFTAIVSLMIGVALRYSGNARDATKSADTVREVLWIQQAVSGMYSGQPSYDGLSAGVVAQSGRVPSRLVTAAGGLTDPYGGTVYVYADPVNQGWDIVLTGLSLRACINVAIAGQQTSPALLQVVVAPGTVGSSSSPSTGGYGSYGLSQSEWAAGVVNACTSNASIRLSWSM